jgi:hypothetical protein
MLIDGKAINPSDDFELLSAHFLPGKIECQYDYRFEKQYSIIPLHGQNFHQLPPRR